jgi:hypothetical protein
MLKVSCERLREAANCEAWIDYLISVIVFGVAGTFHWV